MSKVVLITGGSSGIGKSIGEFLLSKGYVVYGTSRNPERYESSRFKLIALDVADVISIQKAVKTVIEASEKIDILINNAGAGITGPIEETPDIEIKRNFETNFFGPINVIKSVLPQMRQQNSGLIINITSIAGFMGLPYRGVYCASKGALGLITEALRMEVKDFNIQVTNLAPGDVATNIAAGRYHVPATKGSSYDPKYGSILKAIDDDVDKGNDPRLIAKAVYKIINTSNPKIHYRAGAFMQKFSVILKRVLPGKIYEKLIVNHHKL